MIPKKIHYVWVGGNKKPKNILKCMKTWKKHLKNYEIIEWSESNFDINSHPYLKAAYKAKKWAYVSDFIRMSVIYKYGGIYLDTDVIVLDNFDKYINNKAFVGYENPDYPFTAVFGAQKGHPFVKKILQYYDTLKKISFEFNNNNTISVSNILINDYKCKKGNIEQLLSNGLKVYKEDVFCNPSKNSTTIHVFTGTWLEGSKTMKKKIAEYFKIRINSKKKAELYRKIFMKKEKN